MTGPALRLLRHDEATRPFARRGVQTLSVGRFLHDVACLAEALPAGKPIANLCQDRYRFAVGFAAALSRGCVTLLPPSDIPAVLHAMLAGYPDALCLTDTAQPDGLACLDYPKLPPQGSHRRVSPWFGANQLAAILFTSGSTGQPQPYPRSWGLLVSSALSAGREIGAPPGASLIGTVPHQHSYGLESLIMLALQHGLVLQAERPFFPHDIIAVLSKVPPPRILVTTPVHLKLLLAESQTLSTLSTLSTQPTLPTLDLVLSATAPLEPSLAIAAEEGFAAPVHEIYGCSEIGQLASRRTLHGDEWRCLDGFSLRQNGSATWATSHGCETGLADIIELRDSRHFRLLGRSTDLVNIAGKRSSLAALAAHLCAIDGVADGVFVTAGVSQLGRQYLEAYVVAPGRTQAGLLAHLRLRIDPVFLPRRLHLVPALPRNPLGKLTQAALWQLQREDQES
jgi:acyl-coenzyme A synthetase/AMP-(fatty) acid ligase